MACGMASVMTFKQFINWQKISFMYRILSRPCKFLDKCFNYFYHNSILFDDIRSILWNNYNILDLLNNDVDAIKSRIYFIQNHEPTLR